jgi:hypothetical protein
VAEIYCCHQNAQKSGAFSSFNPNFPQYDSRWSDMAAKRISVDTPW